MAVTVAGTLVLVVLVLASFWWRASAMAEATLLSDRLPSVMTFAHRAELTTDGVRARAGAPYNSELATLIELGGSLEWDLGRTVGIQKAFIQADNDDSYALLVSEDRQHWRTLWEASPTGGAGLRSRSTTELDAQARYVRLEPRGGDGVYSVAEVALGAPSEAAWPPQLDEQDGSAVRERGEAPLGWPMGSAAAVAATTLAAVRVLRKRKGRPSFRPLRWVVAVLSVFFVGTALSYATGHRFNLTDDTYTSLQYAKNLASGNGLVFNLGERVEGYTNFLWVLLLSPLWPLSGKDPALMARAATWLTLAFATSAIALVAAIAHRAYARKLIPAALALLLFAFDDAFLSYTVVFALENHLLIALMLAGLALLLYRPRYYELGLGASFAMAGMTRPDGLLWSATFFAVYGAALLFRAGAADTAAETLDLRSLTKVALGFVLLFVPYFVFRVWYFGDWLPNTFYLKVGRTTGALERGLDYVVAYCRERGWVPLAALVSCFLVRAAWARWLQVYVVLHTLYVVYVGGDFYSGHRFLMVSTPLVSLLAGASLARFVEAPSRAWKRHLALAATFAGVLAVRWGTLRHGPYTTDVHGWGAVVDNNVKYMQWLKGVARPGASMVVGDIGATGLFADVRVIDVFGIIDREVARKEVPGFGTGKAGHEKVATRQEQLARKPTYIKWGYVGDYQAPPGYYIFNDFPPHLRVEALWVKDDLVPSRRVVRTVSSFSPAELMTWARSGDAFDGAPASGGAAGQGSVNGHRGTFINTFTNASGDRATGRLTSQPFTLEGDRMHLLVGGGRDPERLRVSLVADGQRRFSETGTNWETLGRRVWDIRALRGKLAHLEIVDEATGAWGHLLVDEIEELSGLTEAPGYL